VTLGRHEETTKILVRKVEDNQFRKWKHTRGKKHKNNLKEKLGGDCNGSKYATTENSGEFFYAHVTVHLDKFLYNKTN
jgi:hypothetical protein